MASKIALKHFKEDLEKILLNDVTHLDPAQKSKRKAKAKNGRTGFEYFCRTYLPHYFTDNSPKFHGEIIDMIEQKSNVIKPRIIVAPRGFSKSTLVSFAWPIWRICFKHSNFIVIVSESDDLSADLVEFIKMEFSSNQRIRDDFGELLASFGEKKDFVANGVRVMARGRRQMQRGFKYRQHRPDLIILDDIESDDVAKSPKQVKKILGVIKDGIYPSIAPGGKLVIVGTVLQKRCVLGSILNATEGEYLNWDKKIYRSIYMNDAGNDVSLWPARWPLATLKGIREEIGTRSFNREYQNNPPDDESAMFKEEWLRYYHPNELIGRSLKIASFVDPSAREKKKNDFKAIITIARDIENGKFYFIHAWLRHASINSMLRATYRIYKKFSPSVIGVEDNGFQALLADEYDHLTQEMNCTLPLRMITNTRNKENRVESMSPYFESGKILFPSDADDEMKLLIEQILQFPNGEFDDGPDAAQTALSLVAGMMKQSKFHGSKKRLSHQTLNGYDNTVERRDFNRPNR